MCVEREGWKRGERERDICFERDKERESVCVCERERDSERERERDTSYFLKNKLFVMLS